MNKNNLASALSVLLLFIAIVAIGICRMLDHADYIAPDRKVPEKVNEAKELPPFPQNSSA